MKFQNGEEVIAYYTREMAQQQDELAVSRNKVLNDHEAARTERLQQIRSNFAAQSAQLRDSHLRALAELRGTYIQQINKNQAIVEENEEKYVLQNQQNEQREEQYEANIEELNALQDQITAVIAHNAVLRQSIESCQEEIQVQKENELKVKQNQRIIAQLNEAIERTKTDISQVRQRLEAVALENMKQE